MWQNAAQQISAVSIAVYVVLIAAELGYGFYVRRNTYEVKDTFCSIAMGGFYLVTKALLKGVTFFLLYLAAAFAPWHLGFSIPVFIAAYLVVDFFFYWLHRFMHEVRFGWAAHVNHHSSQKFNLGGTALRQSFFEPVFEAFFYAPIVLLGFDPLLVLAALELNLIYMFWVHTEHIGKLPRWYEYLFVTPSHHRVHHASNIEYLDKNYSGTFIFWDRLFGTFEEEKAKPVFGILKQIDTYNPVKASLHEWAALARDIFSVRGLGNKLAFLIMPPGWAPGGQGVTTRERQRALKTKGSNAA